jgi:hypothetical protein
MTPTQTRQFFADDSSAGAAGPIAVVLSYNELVARLRGRRVSCIPAARVYSVVPAPGLRVTKVIIVIGFRRCAIRRI